MSRDVADQAAGEAARDAAADAAKRAERVHRLYEQARAAWPQFALDEPLFARHLAERLPAASDEALDALHTNDLYLACACAAGDAKALTVFERAFVAQITDHLSRRHALPGFSDELKQVLRERLLVAQQGLVPRIAGYSGRGSLAAWVRVTATREAVDLRKKMSSGKTSELLPEHAPIAPSDPELELLRRQYGDVVRQAIATAIQALDANEATVLRLFFLEGLKQDSIASLFKTSERTVQRWVANARQKILDETRRLLGERLGGSATQLDSLIRLVRADLEPSLVKLLKKSPGP